MPPEASEPPGSDSTSDSGISKVAVNLQQQIPTPDRMRRLIITAHGIRTHADWQGRLQKLFPKPLDGMEYEFRHANFGFYSFLEYILPWSRSAKVRWCADGLLEMIEEEDWERIHIVAHSFGTHMIAHALALLAKQKDFKIHTVIFAGSVLKVDHMWRPLLGRNIHRLINECGRDDNVLLVNQLFVWGTGAAGRFGFSGMLSNRFCNRKYGFGHSGYFEAGKGRPHEDFFMLENWLPLLLRDEDIEMPIEPRRGPLRDAVDWCFRHSEPIKLGLLISPFLVVVWILTAALVETRKQKGIAENNEWIAKLAQVESERQGLLAEINKWEAIWAGRLAQTRQKEAERRAYQSQIIAANQLLRQDRMAEAREILFKTSPEFRRWEWGLLTQLCGPAPGYVSGERVDASKDGFGIMAKLTKEALPSIIGPLQESKKKDWPLAQRELLPFKKLSHANDRMCVWAQYGGRSGAQAYVIQRKPGTLLMRIRAGLYQYIFRPGFSSDDTLLFLSANPFKTSFGDVVTSNNSVDPALPPARLVIPGKPLPPPQIILEDKDVVKTDVLALSIPERFDLSKLSSAKNRLFWGPIQFLDSGAILLTGTNDGDDNITERGLELVFKNQSGHFQLTSTEPVKHDDPYNDKGLSWLDGNPAYRRNILSTSKKLWRSKFAHVNDGIGRALGDHFTMDGQDCVIVIKSNDTVEIWSVREAARKSSFGSPSGEPCYHEILNQRQDGVYDGLKRQPGGCLIDAAATVNVTAARVFAWGTVYDLMTGAIVCELLDEKGKSGISLGAIEPAADRHYTAQLDPNGEFLAVRLTGRNDEGFGIWNAKTGAPIFQMGEFAPDREGREEENVTDVWGSIPGIRDVAAISWSIDGKSVVLANEDGEVFLKHSLLDEHATKVSGINLSAVIEDRAGQAEGQWSPVQFPVRYLDDERLLIANYVVDTATWSVLLELPKNTEINESNSLAATWTSTGELEFCDMSFWRAYRNHVIAGVNLRDQLLLLQVAQSDAREATSP